MSREIITIHISNDMDTVLAHKYTIQIADFLGLSISEHTQFATAISEICRNCVEFAGSGVLTYEIITENGKNYILATIDDKGKGIPKEEFKEILLGNPIRKNGRGQGIMHSRILTDKFVITSCDTGTCVKLYKRIPGSQKRIGDEDIIAWKKHFENDKHVSHYEEIKKRNQRLLQLTEELQVKNTETERQLAEITRLNAELNESHFREQEGNEIFKFITENISQIIYRTDADGLIQFMNSHFKVYLGLLHEEEAVNVDFQKFIHPDDIKEFNDKWEKGINTGKEFEFIHRTLRHDGAYRWHKSSAKPIYDIAGKLLMWIGTSVDIDDQQKWSEELEKTVADRTQDLLITNAELNRSNQDLEQYAYIASHDLKEPIRMVSNFTSLLAKKYHDKLDSEANEFIGFISEGASRMQYLVNDLLTYSTIGRNDSIKKPVDCNKVLKIVLTNLEEKIKVEGARITIDKKLPEIPGVESMLIQLFQNLIDNALKFKGDKNSEIHIKALKKGKLVLFKVTDNGLGINPQFADKIFIMFHRLNARDKYQGTGMGLAICKKIVEFHDGQIWLDSKENAGTTFNFTLSA